ncbi:hypothetical protein [Mycobacterium sp. 1081908.1]|uniref:hypothetical protein n=1 Tax=Mycobacterium sp. 1081908.1 TaxID=1834066 RepID=UPI0007FDE2D2|nr:hypothetical protein [Mycobacterium sp. 1081908.1]OBK43392.1 hypothetical protein A5655_16630 [Mycobacterium sp. 1081908.1]
MKASSAEVTEATESAGASGDAPAGRKTTIALLAAVACTVLGAKLVTISALASPMPFFDQWDGEAAFLYSPYLKGTLSVANLFAPHNEHRIFVFRLLALLHLELAGEWNTRLEMIFGAIVHTAAITWLAALLMRLVTVRRRLLLACFTAILFALPIGYENTLSGFQSQVYLALFFGIAALVAFASARPFSARWFCGAAAAVLSYFSFATGVATVLAAGAIVSVQLATNARKRGGREFAGVAVLAAIAVAMIVWATSSARPMSTTPWTFIQGLLLVGGQSIVGLVPMVWFCLYTLKRRPVISDRAWVAVAISGWLCIQLVLLAYGRGASVAVRYLDIVLFVYPVALMAMLSLLDGARVARFGRYAKPAVVTWVFAVTTGVGALGWVSVVGAIGWGESAHQQEVDVQTYLATRNALDLKGNGGHRHMFDLTYPSPQRLATLLGDPDIRAILPHEFRPADARNDAARGHMWLKGSLAGGTATAVRLTLAAGPALLALGVSLFFAVAARRGLPSR